MRQVIYTFLLALIPLFAVAQDSDRAPQGHEFSPKDFEAGLEQYVVKEAGLTKEEEAKFLPIYREMRQKQVETMKKEHINRDKMPATEEEWAAAVKAHDDAELQLKKIAATYHNKLLSVLAASKVMKVLRAENEYHRDIFRQHIGKNPPPRPKK